MTVRPRGLRKTKPQGNCDSPFVSALIRSFGIEVAIRSWASAGVTSNVRYFFNVFSHLGLSQVAQAIWVFPKIMVPPNHPF